MDIKSVFDFCVFIFFPILQFWAQSIIDTGKTRHMMVKLLYIYLQSYSCRTSQT